MGKHKRPSKAERQRTLDAFILEQDDHPLAPAWLENPKLRDATPEQVTEIFQNIKPRAETFRRAEGPSAVVRSFSAAEVETRRTPKGGAQ